MTHVTRICTGAGAGELQVPLYAREVPPSQWAALTETVKAMTTQVVSAKLVYDQPGSKAHIDIVTQFGHLSGTKLTKAMNSLINSIENAVEHKIKASKEQMAGARR